MGELNIFCAVKILTGHKCVLFRPHSSHKTHSAASGMADCGTVRAKNVPSHIPPLRGFICVGWCAHHL